MLPRLYSHNYIEHPDKPCNPRRAGLQRGSAILNIWIRDERPRPGAALLYLG